METIERLKNLRLSRGWTQEDLSKILNVQKSAVSKYERGEIEPSCGILRKMSAVFGVSIDYLLDNDAAKDATPALNKTEATLIRRFNLLPDHERVAVLNLVATLTTATRPATSSAQAV